MFNRISGASLGKQVNVERVVGSCSTSIASCLHKDVADPTRTQDFGPSPSSWSQTGKYSEDGCLASVLSCFWRCMGLGRAERE
jgi:hypothetical protein